MGDRKSAVTAPDLIRFDGHELTIGRSATCDLRLRHSSVSRHHATIIRDTGRLRIDDHNSRFGTFVNEVRVRRQQLRVGDRLRLGTVDIYRVESTGLRPEQTPHGCALTATELTISRTTSEFSLTTNASRTLVSEASFAVRPDTFVGILGPSGAGKSTLLNCIGSYIPYQGGALTFDEEHHIAIRTELYRQQLGHVPQQEDLIGNLTVRENLEFSSRLQADTRTSSVAEVLKQSGLTRHAEKLTKTLSGGQRKRVSVAMELLKRPRLLLLDEPTSGLDPASEANLMEHLRIIADRGSTVLCTTHLMDHIRLFDQLIVLGVVGDVGRIAYIGAPEGLLSRFQCRSYADLYEVLANGKFPITSHATEPNTTAPVPVNLKSENSTRTSAVISDDQRPATSLSTGVVLQDIVSPSADCGVDLDQFRAFVARSFLSISRNRGLTATLIAQPAALGLLVSVSQYRTNAVAVHFFTTVIAIWLGLNNSARVLVGERRRYIRERVGGIDPFAYLAATACVYFLVGLAQVLVLLVVLRLSRGFLLPSMATDLQMVSVIRELIVMQLAYTGGLATGLLLSTLATSEQTAVAWLPLIIMPQLMLSVVATGWSEQQYGTARPRPFQPLVMTVRSPDFGTVPSACIELSSLLLLSRPATLALTPSQKLEGIKYSTNIWLADLTHLLLLDLLLSLTVVWVFLKREQQWPRLIGIA